jgi:hypothetical protein
VTRRRQAAAAWYGFKSTRAILDYQRQRAYR